MQSAYIQQNTKQIIYKIKVLSLIFDFMNRDDMKEIN